MVWGIVEGMGVVWWRFAVVEKTGWFVSLWDGWYGVGMLLGEERCCCEV